jgi:hypothetical protein
MKVIVDSDQLRRLAINILDRIYGPLRKTRGTLFSNVYVDDNGNPRIAVHDVIFYPKSVYILKEDFIKFKSVIPVSELEFAELFKDWIERNYDVRDLGTLTTTLPEKMGYIKPRPKAEGNFNY